MKETFLTIRPRLFALAYRMTRSVADAEDIVQDVFLAADHVAPESVREPEAYLIRMVTNRCFTVLTAKSKTVYPGPDLPEPLVLDCMPGLAAMDLSYGLLVLLHRLSPMERAVFVLRETMDYSYAEIADFLSISGDHCRQLLHRARQAIASGTRSAPISPEQLRELLLVFQQAVASGETTPLLDWLHDDIVIQTDGGGKRIAALKPIVGRQHCLAFLTGLYQKWSAQLNPQFAEINGEAGLLLYDPAGQPETAMLFHLQNHQVLNIYMVRNPDKLKNLQNGAALFQG